MHPIFLEYLRESIGLHTCDRRRTKHYLERTYRDFRFKMKFTQEDKLWTPDYQETFEEQVARLRKVLDWIWKNDESRYISITAHSGTLSAILKNIGHREFSVQTGGMIPVVVKGQPMRRSLDSSGS